MSTPVSSPSPSSSEPPGRFQGSGTSSNLYLVTFLATLFLLLFVSCAIVLRSYILRRRYQRRLEEAMAAGMLLAPRTQGSKRKRFGAKPKLLDTWLADGGEKWDQMTPLSAQPVFVKRKLREGTIPKPTTTDDPSSPPPGVDPPINDNALPSSGNSHVRPGVRGLFQKLRPNSSIPPNEPEDAGVPPTTTPQTHKIRVEMLQVSVLIAMPSPNRRAQIKNAALDSKKSFDSDRIGEEDEDEEVLPELVFGVTRVNYRQPKPSTTTLLAPPSPLPSPLHTPRGGPSREALAGGLQPLP